MIDASDRVSGSVRYTIDIRLPGMLEARLLRSPFAHARVLAIDASRARKLRGVVLLTGADLGGRTDIRALFGPVFRDQPILAHERVRFVGDPVAAVAAPDLDTASEAVDLIEVEYEELPAVFGLDEALDPHAPIVHPEAPLAGQTAADLIVHSRPGTNICNEFRLRKGDFDRAFAEADFVFDDVFPSPPVQHVALETHACVAEMATDHLTVWSATQTPFNVRAQLAEIFRWPESSVRVVVPNLGGGFGGKCYPKLEPITAVLAQAAGRPVRLHLTRGEDFITVTKHGARIRLQTGVQRDGTIVARKGTCHFNTGAYADIGPRLIKNGGYATAGPYAIPNVWIDSYAVYTNLPPAGAFRGYGVNQAAWAYESQMDLIADRIGIDPRELRRRNLLREGQTLMTGEPIRGSHLHELLDDVAGWIGWDERSPEPAPGHARGKGLACVIKSTVTPSTSSATVQVDEGGALKVLTSSVEMGQGVSTALARMAAERFGVAIQDIQVSTPDTEVTPYDQQTSSSRSTHSMGGAVALAADDLEQELKRLGSDVLEAAAEDLELARGVIAVRGVPDRKVAMGDLARSQPGGLLAGHGTFAVEGGLDPETGQGVASVHWHQAAGAAEVDVDLETGKVAILRYRASVYAGRVINRIMAELQTEGNVAFGVGQALFEELIFDHGQLVNGNLSDYMIASINDLPDELSIRLIEHPEEGDIHGIGETSLPPVMAAIGNAVYHATGVRVTDLPITPERLLRLLRDA